MLEYTIKFILFERVHAPSERARHFNRAFGSDNELKNDPSVFFRMSMFPKSQNKGDSPAVMKLYGVRNIDFAFRLHKINKNTYFVHNS